MKKELEQELEETIELMKSLVDDTTVPRNIRSVVSEATKKLLEEGKDKSIGLGSAIYALEDISNDINMPSHTRTEIWTVISALESLKEKINQK